MASFFADGLTQHGRGGRTAGEHRHQRARSPEGDRQGCHDSQEESPSVQRGGEYRRCCLVGIGRALAPCYSVGGATNRAFSCLHVHFVKREKQLMCAVIVLVEEG